MGEAFTKDLVSKGWHVAMFDVNKNGQLVSSLGDAVSFYKGSVASYADQGKCFEDVWKTHGRLDLVSPNAGIIDRRLVMLFKAVLLTTAY